MDSNQAPRRASLFVGIEVGYLWGTVRETTPEPEPEADDENILDLLDSDKRYFLFPGDTYSIIATPPPPKTIQSVEARKTKLNSQYRFELPFEEYAENYRAVSKLMEIQSQITCFLGTSPASGQIQLIIEYEQVSLPVVPLRCDIEEESFVVDLLSFH
jgi:hypothetical protein